MKRARNKTKKQQTKPCTGKTAVSPHPQQNAPLKAATCVSDPESHKDNVSFKDTLLICLPHALVLYEY